MKRNRQKDILDLLIILLWILSCIFLKYIENSIICYIPLAISVILVIIDRKLWKCKKCSKYLPTKIWFKNVICCPYCKEDVEK